jgi:glycine cleavage system regulatory protein
MFTYLIITIIGTDRPGLVQSVASQVADNGGNWLESRMCHLGGQFAGIARVEVAGERVAGLRAALQKLEAAGIRVSIDQGGESSAAPGGVAATIELVGQDRPGILRDVTSVLASHRVNVEDLSSECVSAPMGGGTLFQARVRVLVPSVDKMELVRADLEKIAADLMVDLTLRPVSGVQ